MKEHSVKERPILFSGPMVRAILEGRKTQTRRVVRVQGESYRQTLDADKSRWFIKGGGSVRCPYGVPGDRLWVRETFRCNGWATDVATIFYKANECNSYTEMCEQFPVDGKKPLPVDGRWRPSIHMPRWASRITLEIKAIRVERLQDISEEDAEAEGCYTNQQYCDMAGCYEGLWPCPSCGGFQVHGAISVPSMGVTEVDCRNCETAKQRFQQIWQSINGPGSWDANPWVWVVEFERTQDTGEE